MKHLTASSPWVTWTTDDFTAYPRRRICDTTNARGVTCPLPPPPARSGGWNGNGKKTRPHHIPTGSWVSRSLHWVKFAGFPCSPLAAKTYILPIPINELGAQQSKFFYNPVRHQFSVFARLLSVHPSLSCCASLNRDASSIPSKIFTSQAMNGAEQNWMSGPWRLCPETRLSLHDARNRSYHPSNSLMRFLGRYAYAQCQPCGRSVPPRVVQHPSRGKRMAPRVPERVRALLG